MAQAPDTIAVGIDPLTIGGAMRAAAAAWPMRDALVYDDRRATWRAFDAEVTVCARRLIGIGVGPDAHVGILMPNCWDLVILYHAINLIGARAVLLNARYRADDLAYVIPKAQIEFLFIGGHARAHCDYRPMLAELYPELASYRGGPLTLAAAPKLRLLIELGDDRPAHWMQEAGFTAAADGVTDDQVAARAAAVSPDQIGLLIFSSGTTSRPKACMLNHRSMTLTGRALAERFRMSAQDRVWDPLPLFHMSTILPLAACRAVGACFIGMSHFDADTGLAMLMRERPTIHYAGFPTIIGALVTHPDFLAYDQSALRINHVVGPADLLRRYATHFPGAVAVNSYGLTEATGVPCYSELDDDANTLATTSGRLFPGMEAKIIDADGAALPPGSPGEICLRGFCIFPGYFDDPEATAAAVDADGWLHTGDLGRLRADGRLSYEGRIKDMLKIGGENVAAVELESFLMTHPSVRMAQVIGVPDDRLMEVAAAFIELNPGCTMTADAVIDHCVGKIASYKIPRYVRFVDDWPMSATKVQKFQLRQAFVPEGRFDIAARMGRTPRQ